MKRKIVTIGTSAGVTIAPADLRELGLSVGDAVEVTVRSGILEVRPLRSADELSHDELMAWVEREFGK